MTCQWVERADRLTVPVLYPLAHVSTRDVQGLHPDTGGPCVRSRVHGCEGRGHGPITSVHLAETRGIAGMT